MGATEIVQSVRPSLESRVSLHMSLVEQELPVGDLVNIYTCEVNIAIFSELCVETSPG